MMNTATLLGIGVVLLILLWAGARRRNSEFSDAAGSAPDQSEFLVQLPPCTLLARCLAVEDQVFVTRLGSPTVLKLLLQERRRLALEWLRLTRRESRRLFGLHVRQVRYAEDLQPAAEVKLVADVLLFLAVYQMMVFLVRFYGPFRTKTYVRSIQGLAGVLSGLGGRIAATVDSGLASSPAAGGE